jgi:hypothetical protein
MKTKAAEEEVTMEFTMKVTMEVIVEADTAVKVKAASLHRPEQPIAPVSQVSAVEMSLLLP